MVHSSNHENRHVEKKRRNTSKEMTTRCISNLSPSSVPQVMPPLIRHSLAQDNSSINTALEQTWISFCEELEQQRNQTLEHILTPSKPEKSINTMAPKKLTINTKSVTTNLKVTGKSSTPI